MNKPMKMNLEKIYQERIQHQQELKHLKIKYLTVVYDGIVKNKKVSEIHKKLLEETINRKKVDEKMFHAVDKYVKVVKKQTNLKTGGALIMALLQSINKLDAQLDHVIVENVRGVAEKEKKSYLHEEIKKNRTDFKEELDAKIWYLASKHDDSALDHKDFQGLMYIDENWRSVIKSAELRKQINIYINKHHVKTIQWVTGKPVWFVTRPYCRHYFQAISVREGLGISLNSLLDRYKMHTEIGNREYLQTLPRKKQEITYIIAKYKERLELHRALYAVNHDDIVKKAIEKDLFLIRKWEDALKN